jgi:hypothetical protein
LGDALRAFLDGEPFSSIDGSETTCSGRFGAGTGAFDVLDPLDFLELLPFVEFLALGCDDGYIGAM